MAKPLSEALAALDPLNDNHWTGDGLPRLDTVRLLADNSSVTRDQVTAAAPGLSRATAGQQGTQAAATGVSTTQAPAAAPAPVQGPSQGASNGEEGARDGAAADTAAEAGEEGALGELAAAQARLKDALAVQVEAQRQVEAAQAEVDRLIVETTAGAETFAQGVRSYLDRQAANREEQVRRRQALKGIDLKDILPSRSQLDNALARRTARGTQRPTKV